MYGARTARPLREVVDAHAGAVGGRAVAALADDRALLVQGGKHLAAERKLIGLDNRRAAAGRQRGQSEGDAASHAAALSSPATRGAK